MIRLENLGITFGSGRNRVDAVRGVSFQVGEGEGGEGVFFGLDDALGEVFLRSLELDDLLLDRAGGDQLVDVHRQ